MDPELARGWTWTERYAQQPEIERYIHYVVDRMDLRKDFKLSTRVTRLIFDDETARWRVETDRGDVLSARFVVSGVGGLSAPNLPQIEGLSTFEGETYHTGLWPKEEVDLSGKRVAVIGTGSSGVQSIPRIADVASQLYVFQRTAQYTVPAGQRVLDPNVEVRFLEEMEEWREQSLYHPTGFLGVKAARASALDDTDDEFRRKYDERWAYGGALDFLVVHDDVIRNEEANERVCEYVREKIREIVKDPETAERLSPKLPIGAKRFIVDTGYFETYNRDNVTLISIRDTPIERVTPNGLVVDGTEYEVDAIVFATGYDAVTGTLLRIDLRGRDGLTLAEAWKDGPATLFGLQVARFPNLFTIIGPLSPSLRANVILGIEVCVDWIVDTLVYLRDHDLDTIEAGTEAQDEWIDHTADVIRGTIYERVDTWYLGANIPGKPRRYMIYMGGFDTWRGRLEDARASDYPEFVLGRTPLVPA
jgi:cyclohexanone monooxygenase